MADTCLFKMKLFKKCFDKVLCVSWLNIDCLVGVCSSSDCGNCICCMKSGIWIGCVPLLGSVSVNSAS